MLKRKVMVGIWVVLFVFAMCVSLYAAEKGLVGYWKFDEGKDKKAKDVSGKGNDGEITDGKWISGKFGYALQFEEGGVDCGTDPSLSITDAITIEVWIKYSEDLEGDRGEIVSKQTTSGNEGYRISKNAGENIVWHVSSYPAIFSTDPVSPGIWYHIAAVSCEDYTRLYINGVESISDEGAEIIDDEGIPFTIGKHADEDGVFFKGIIDEVKVYNRALSDTEVKASYEKNAELYK